MEGDGGEGGAGTGRWHAVARTGERDAAGPARLCSAMMPLRARILVVALVAGAACGGRRSSDPESGHFVRPGAPDPLACASDDACVSGPAVDPSDGCCDSGVHLGVFGRGYVEWRAGWMREACVGHVCPPLQSPALPLPCFLEGRCVAGRCTHVCESPPQEPSQPVSR